jgi:hypothetical protein
MITFSTVADMLHRNLKNHSNIDIDVGQGGAMRKTSFLSKKPINIALMCACVVK